VALHTQTPTASVGSNGSAGLTFAATGGTKYDLALDDAYGNGDVFKLIFSP